MTFLHNISTSPANTGTLFIQVYSCVRKMFTCQAYINIPHTIQNMKIRMGETCAKDLCYLIIPTEPDTINQRHAQAFIANSINFES